MFDDVNKKNASVQQGADIKKPVEDIFSETEKPSFAEDSDGKPAFASSFAKATADKKASAGKPEVFQPKKKEADDFSKRAPESKSPIDIKKYLILLAIALGVVIFAFASYWAYSTFFQQTDHNLENAEEDVAQDSNGQTIAPQKDADKAQEKVPVQLAQPKDSDQDGLTDEEEAGLGTSSATVDSDDDGLFDREEIKVYKTDPLNADTDGDGFLDGEEVKGGYNPNGPGMLFER